MRFLMIPALSKILLLAPWDGVLIPCDWSFVERKKHVISFTVFSKDILEIQARKKNFDFNADGPNSS